MESRLGRREEPKKPADFPTEQGRQRSVIRGMDREIDPTLAIHPACSSHQKVWGVDGSPRSGDRAVISRRNTFLIRHDEAVSRRDIAVMQALQCGLAAKDRGHVAIGPGYGLFHAHLRSRRALLPGLRFDLPLRRRVHRATRGSLPAGACCYKRNAPEYRTATSVIRSRSEPVPSCRIMSDGKRDATAVG